MIILPVGHFCFWNWPFLPEHLDVVSMQDHEVYGCVKHFSRRLFTTLFIKCLYWLGRRVISVGVVGIKRLLCAFSRTCSTILPAGNPA